MSYNNASHNSWKKYLLILLHLSHTFHHTTSLKCYQCSALKRTKQTPCPGSLLQDFIRADYCRLIALSDGTVINQEPVTETLCRESSVKYQKAKIGQDFLATDGVEVLCCAWDGCNSDINSAKLTKVEYEQYLLQQILGNEYGYFISSDKESPLKSTDARTSTKVEESPNSSSFDTSNESDTSNRRFGTFQNEMMNSIKSDDADDQQIVSSTFLSHGFPKYFIPKLQGSSVIRKQGVESKPSERVQTSKKFAFQNSDSKTINQTKIKPWIKLGGSRGKQTGKNHNQFLQANDRLNQIKLIASGGLSSSFYDQLLYYTRQKNQLNSLGENEKSRTNELDLYLTRESSDALKKNKNKEEKTKLFQDKKEINNQSVPMHSLTKLHCDPSRNCANNQATHSARLLSCLNFSNVKNILLILFTYIAFHNYLSDI